MILAVVLLSTGWLAQLPPGHPDISAGSNAASSNRDPPSYRDVLDQLDGSPDLAKRDKTFEVASAIGKLYALHGRYPEAARYLEESVNKAKAVREVYRRNGKAAGAAAPPGCEVRSEADFEAVAAHAVEIEKKGQRAEAGACAREVMELVLSAEGWLGNARFLQGDVKGARAVYDRVLAIDPEDAGALYARGGLALDQGDKKGAIADLGVFLAKHPDSPRVPTARALLARAEGKTPPPAPMAVPHPPPGGFSAVPPMMAPSGGPGSSPPPLSRETVEAFQKTEQTPEFLAHLNSVVDEAESALAQGRFQDALDKYKQVMPYQPNNGRFRAGMAWALVGLNRQPMADRIWGIAVESDPKAVESLGDTLSKKGDGKGAQAVYGRLASSAPAYAQSAGLAKKQDRN